MSYGYGDWNSGTSRGYEGYSYGYGFGPEGSGPLGYPGGSWGDSGTTETPPRGPDGSDGPGKGRGETGVTPEGQGRGYGGSDRYEPYESYSDTRDLYRAPFDYPNSDYPNSDYRDYPSDYPGDYPNDYRDYHNDYPGDYHDYPNSDYPHHNDYHPNSDYRDYPDYPGDFGGDFAGDADPDSGDFPREFPGRFREDFRGWAREQRSFPGRGSNRRLPSLFAPNILPPEAGAFPGFPRAFPGAFRGLKRIRRGWRTWDADFRPQRKRLRRDSFGKRRKAPGGTEDKTPKTDGSDNSSSDNEEGTEGESGEKEESRGEGEDEEGRDSEKGPLSLPEENSQLRQKLQGGRKSQDRQKKRHRDRMVERIQFVCSLCKFRTFFEDEIQQHLESKFHREHFQFVGTKLPPQTAQFLQEYVANKTRKTEERRRGIRDINGVIQQIQREQDLTQEVGLEHFLRKVEAAHCSACDLLIPMHFGSIHKHLKSPDHNHNRRVMLEQSKRSSLVVARSILNNKLISKKLHRFLRGENPFTDDPEEGEGAGEENPENPEENLENPEENPQNPEENPQNLEENSQNSKENPQNSEENSQNPEENPQNSEENPQNSDKNSQNSEENPQNSEENSQNSKENPQNSEENPQNSEENPQNSKENPQNFEENPKIPEDVEEKPKIPEENPKVEEIPGQEKGTGTNPEGENSPKNSQNSPNSENFPEEFPREEEEENSGMCQE